MDNRFMDDVETQEAPGFFEKVFNRFKGPSDTGDEVDEVQETQLRPSYQYNITVRRQVYCFEDALAAANGLKRGEQQILNLADTEPALRQKIVDFMSGVNYAHDGTWEEIGDNIYLVVPAGAFVEMAPPTARSHSYRN